MKRIFGSIPIVAVLVLLFGLVFNVVEQPKTALAVSPVIKVYKHNPVPEADSSKRYIKGVDAAYVETAWAKQGDTIHVEITEGGMATTSNFDAVITLKGEEADVSTSKTVQDDDSDSAQNATINFDVELSSVGSSSTAAGSTNIAANRFYVKVETDDEVIITVSPSTNTNTIDVGRTVRIGVEGTDPKIKNFSVKDGDISKATSHDLTFDVTDRGSGIPTPESKPDDNDKSYSSTVVLVSNGKCTEAEVVAAIANLKGLTCAAGSAAVDVVTIADSDDYTATTDGYTVNTNIYLAAQDDHHITAVTYDRAGNYDIYDGGDGTTTTAKLTVDSQKPRYISNFAPRTGIQYNSTDKDFDENREWIQLIIADNSDLDSTTIDEDDFVVEGHTIRRVQWHDVKPSKLKGIGTSATATGPLDVDGLAANSADCFNAAGTATDDCDDTGAQIPRPDNFYASGGNPDISVAVGDDNGKFYIKNSIFIQLEDELGPAETPDINIVPDGIKDKAGNKIDDGDLEAVDKIAPKFSYSVLEGPRKPKLLVGEDEEMVITFTSDETLQAEPTVEVSLIATSSTNTSGTALTDIDIEETGTRTWKATIGEPTADTAGFYNIYIKGKDTNDNEGDIPDSINVTQGTTNGAAKFFVDSTNTNDVASGAIKYEGDTTLHNPKVTIDGLAAADGKFEFDDPFNIQVFWNETPSGGSKNENAEYNKDTFDDVEITQFDLDGVSILESVKTTDSQRYLIGVENISIGDHKIKIQGVDEAGNKLGSVLEVEFEVDERDPFKRVLNPGWNLVSLPGDPADGSIGSVFTADVPVNTVYSFDPTVPGGWIVAVRETTADAWVGSLSSISSSQAYWVEAEQVWDLKVDVPRLPGGAVGGGTPIQPPIIEIFPGWNMVPIVDVTGDAANGDDYVDADDYFASVNKAVVRILTFDTIQNEWNTLPFSDDPIDSNAGNSSSTSTTKFQDKDIAFGHAVWAYSKEQISLVPGATILE